jgi:DNA-binding NtrC family response regulator
MKTNQLNLLILDDNSLIADPLSKYLNNRFGSRISLSTFIDADECIRNINRNSHVLILNYAMNGEDKGAGRRAEIFKSIRKLNPKTDVTMFTSKQGVFDATLEIQKNASDYIRKKERYLQDALSMIDDTVFIPVKTRIIHPLKKLVQDYVFLGYIIVILAIAAIATAVGITAFKAIQYFS